ncbi:MAG: polyprenyl synthetase family protein, partial [Actinomycetota bacterium]|nr:polyprenyl synthetase family protein [Actinomycetota bacterium]
LDLLRAGGGLPGPEGATKVARYKSAGYTVQRPLLLGAALAGAGDIVREAYTRIGLPLGEAFQLRDDVLGVFGDARVTGKPAGDDLREGKRTVLAARAMSLAGAQDRTLLLDGLGDRSLDEAQVSRIASILEDSGAARQVEELIDELVDESLSHLDAAGLDDPGAAMLREIARAAVDRTA